MSTKSHLKAARECIDQKDFEGGKQKCLDVLESDASNYNALVFLGLCEMHLGHREASERSFLKAIDASPDLPLARQVLCRSDVLRNTARDW